MEERVSGEENMLIFEIETGASPCVERRVDDFDPVFTDVEDIPIDEQYGFESTNIEVIEEIER